MMISVNNHKNNNTNNSDFKNIQVKFRLCHLKTDKNFGGYGFNLHAEKNKHGHYIGNIDPNSPAETAGLKEGDRVIEVNGSNVEMETHKQVVNRIRLIPSETKLLVIDSNHIQSNNMNECPFNGHVYPALNLQISVAEFRAKLAERKKYDPKKEPIAFRKKYEIVEKL